ncbi:DEP domain-containing protein 1A, partial [Galemys pyrenaicus]
WNEVTTSFRAGMPLRKHRQHFKKYGNCFTAGEAVDWLYDLLRNNSNFGPEVTRQQTIQLLRKFLKNHVIEDIKGKWGSENLDDNSQLFSNPFSFPPIPQENAGKMNCEIINEDQENSVNNREISQEDVEEVWKYVILTYLQTILGVSSLEEVINPKQVIPQYVMYNMTNTSKHGIVILQDKSDDLPHWVLSAMKCLANWPRSNDLNNPTYVGFERDVFRTIADYFLHLPEPLLTFEYYELFVNILGLLQPHLERVAIDALQLCCLLLPPPNRRKLQLLMRMISRMSQNVDMPRLHDTMGTRSLIKNPGEELIAPLPTYSYCKQISTQEFDEQKVSTSQAAISELLENIIKNKSLPLKEKRKKLKQVRE